ncbi:hypothetical protein EV44_g1726 [Erysiphe necator]|uniref:Uncharacterized protein n=1 Tax=Uncinula necator TaxID=52586 RepID=A0A0B1NVN1_UNCNE|nr:hypothetical protein EV44_g1726 [Erysiphe necator]
MSARSHKSSNSKVTIMFGPRRKAYEIPRSYLLDQHWLIPNVNYYDSSLDEEIGHILVHYVHTGEYHTPMIDETAPARIRGWMEIRIAIQVLLATEYWIMPGLRGIARAHIQSLTESINICHLVELVDTELSKPSLPRIPNSRQWLYNHLSKALENAFQKDKGIFDELMEFNNFEDISLYKMLTKAMVRIMDRRIFRAAL